MLRANHNTYFLQQIWWNNNISLGRQILVIVPHTKAGGEGGVILKAVISTGLRTRPDILFRNDVSRHQSDPWEAMQQRNFTYNYLIFILVRKELKSASCHRSGFTSHLSLKRSHDLNPFSNFGSESYSYSLPQYPKNRSPLASQPYEPDLVCHTSRLNLIATISLVAKNATLNDGNCPFGNAKVVKIGLERESVALLKQPHSLKIS